MARLVKERQFGDLQPDGWHYPRVRKLGQRRSPRKRRIVWNVDFDESVIEEPEPAEDLIPHIDALEREDYALRARIKRLQDAGNTVISQREHWKARALAAEELLKSERDRRSRGTDRFDALRRIVAKELHPDHCAGGDFEKLARREFFKRLWAEIERLARQR